MNFQTRTLLGVTLPNTPSFIQPLIDAYQPDPKNPKTELEFNLYPEPYYGDFNQCSVVLLTHNPGNSTQHWKGLNSQFETIIYQGNAPEMEYYKMAMQPAFPNPATNSRFYNPICNQLHQHFQKIQAFENRPFIRDLVPYHSGEFGKLNMPACAAYLYKYFFNQVIAASFKSELYQRINSTKDIKHSAIIYARGKAWKDAIYGLSSVGWQQIGKIYSYCYIFKADFQSIQAIEGFDLNLYPTEILTHNLYIVVITQARQGANFGVYINNRAPLHPINLETIIGYYDNAVPKEAEYIAHNEEMDTFINTIR
jgi:hypothetical protein